MKNYSDIIKNISFFWLIIGIVILSTLGYIKYHEVYKSTEYFDIKINDNMTCSKNCTFEESPNTIIVYTNLGLLSISDAAISGNFNSIEFVKDDKNSYARFYHPLIGDTKRTLVLNYSIWNKLIRS